MIAQHGPADPVIHETSIRAARRCRSIVQGCLREEEWIEADREFYLAIRQELEAALARLPAFTRHEGRPEAAS